MKILRVAIGCVLLGGLTGLASCNKPDEAPVPAVFENEIKFALANDFQMQHLTVGDMDGDGMPDLVASLQDNLLVYRNMSTPGKLNRTTFEGPIKFENPGSLHWVELFDVDKDGRMDVAQSRNVSGNHYVSLFRNKGTGAFNAQSLDAPVSFLLDREPYSFKAADLNMDGKTDLVLSGSYSFSILGNNSSGGAFTASTFANNVVFDANIDSEVAVGDLTGDGRLDIAAPLFESNPGLQSPRSIGFGLFKYSSSGSVITSGTFAQPSVLNARNTLSTNINDIDGDGGNELTLNYRDSIVFHKSGPSTGGISMSVSKRMPLTFAINTYFEDFNGDHKPELFIVRLDVATGTIKLDAYINTSTFSAISFADPQTFNLSTVPFSLYFVDMDGDGKKDIVGTLAPDIMVLKNISF